MSYRKSCRLCLSTDGFLEDLFGEDDNLNMVQKIAECTGIEVQCFEELPSCICEICKSEIIIWSKFKRQCLRTNDILKSQYPELFEISSKESFEQPELIVPEYAIDASDETTDCHKKLSDTAETDAEKCEFNAILESSDNDSEIDSSEEQLVYKIEYTSDEDAEHLQTESMKTETLEIVAMSDNFEEIEDSRSHPAARDNEEEIMKNGEKAKSKLGEVWKSMKGERIRYHTRCKICGKLQQNLKQHMLIHNNETPFHCPYCGRGFRQRSNYKHHIYIHTGEKPYTCKTCDRSFSDPASLRSHKVLHTGERNYKCDICGKAFGHSHTLAAHRRIHTQEKRHGCNICTKRFLSKHALKKHIRTHTGERPYQCDQCPKTFATSGNLSTHKRVHTKERPFKCEVCDMQFAYRCVLNTHMKRHSNNKLLN